MRPLRLATIFCLFAAFLGDVLAGDPILLAIEAQELAATDVPGAIALVDAELAAERAKPKPDVRVLQALLHLKADVLTTAGHSLAAAELYLELADFTEQHSDLLHQSPRSYARTASKLFAAAGELERAEEILNAVRRLERSNLASEAVQKATLEELILLARGRGDAEAATSYEREITQLRSPRPQSDVRLNNDSEMGFEEVQIYYATGRAPTGDLHPQTFYGAQRGELQYGTALVTIPKTHRPGALERPSIWSFEFSASIDKHVMLQEVTPSSEGALLAQMRRHLDAKSARDAFVFVHGFNVSFAEAAERTAQLAYDMNFSGLPILYSWPSQGETWSYLMDTAVVRLSGRHLLPFLESVVARSGATRVHLVAHSMGNRALTDALELLALQHGSEGGALFDQVVFAAPDVDTDLFAEMITTIRPLARRMTLYASEHDWALRISQKLHGDARRAGQGGTETLLNQGLDSIDMSALGDDMLAHSYFAANGSALIDLATLFWQNAAPDHRCGISVEDQQERLAPLWVYHPEQCDGGAILPLIGHLRQRGVRTLAGVREVLRQVVPDAARAQRLEPVVARMLLN